MRRPNRWIGTAALGWCGALGCASDLALDPAAAHRSRDAARAAALDRQLEVLPGVTAARTVLRTPYADPLAPTPTTPQVASATIALRVAPAQQQPAQDAATRLIAGALPDVAPASRTLVVAAEAPAAAYAKVGPFEVAPASKAPLRATLAVTLLVVLALAGFIAWRERRS